MDAKLFKGFFLFAVLFFALLFVLNIQPAANAATDAEMIAKGKELYQSLGCIGCHMINGMGGRIGPDLSKVGSRLKKKRMLGQINNPKQYNPSSMMPSFQSLPEDQKQALVKYLMSLK